MATESGLVVSTIKRLENGGMSKASVENIDKISDALAAAGIEFFNGGEPGVRLRRKA
ncbi:Transcriptional regulator, XRE family (fragment) [Hyphomicrobium sp. MC1]